MCSQSHDDAAAPDVSRLTGPTERNRICNRIWRRWPGVLLIHVVSINFSRREIGALSGMGGRCAGIPRLMFGVGARLHNCVRCFSPSAGASVVHFSSNIQGVPDVLHDRSRRGSCVTYV
ncbi:hypothetical protein VUR80DRAFT_39 [Thermomyces stellatus]